MNRLPFAICALSASLLFFQGHAKAQVLADFNVVSYGWFNVTTSDYVAQFHTGGREYNGAAFLSFDIYMSQGRTDYDIYINNHKVSSGWYHGQANWARRIVPFDARKLKHNSSNVIRIERTNGANFQIGNLICFFNQKA